MGVVTAMFLAGGNMERLVCEPFHTKELFKASHTVRDGIFELRDDVKEQQNKGSGLGYRHHLWKTIEHIQTVTHLDSANETILHFYFIL